VPQTSPRQNSRLIGSAGTNHLSASRVHVEQSANKDLNAKNIESLTVPTRTSTVRCTYTPQLAAPRSPIMDSRRSLPASLASGMDQSSPVVRTRLIAHKNKDVVWSPVKPSKLLQPALRRDVGSILQAKSLPAVLTEDEAQEAVQHQTPSFAACPAVANEDDKKVSRQETGDVASNASTNDKVQGDETPPQNMLSSSSNSSSPGRMAKEDLARKKETVASKPAVQQSGTKKETQNPPKLWSDYQRTTPCLMRSQRNLPESLKPPGTCFPDAVMQSKKNLPEAAKGRQVYGHLHPKSNQ